MPEVSSPTDTSNFDVDDNDLRQCDTQPPQHNPAFSALHLPFVGFSFTMGSRLSDLGRVATNPKKLAAAAAALPASSPGNEDNLDGLSKNAYERRISRMEDEKKELIRKLADSNRALQKLAHGSAHPVNDKTTPETSSNAAEVRKLQDEVNVLTKRNGELESRLVS